jgi:hypothetical protein
VKAAVVEATAKAAYVRWMKERKLTSDEDYENEKWDSEAE